MAHRSGRGHVDVFRRDNGWKREILGLDDTLEVATLGFATSIAALYRRVGF